MSRNLDMSGWLSVTLLAIVTVESAAQILLVEGSLGSALSLSLASVMRTRLFFPTLSSLLCLELFLLCFFFFLWCFRLWPSDLSSLLAPAFPLELFVMLLVFLFCIIFNRISKQFARGFLMMLCFVFLFPAMFIMPWCLMCGAGVDSRIAPWATSVLTAGRVDSRAAPWATSVLMVGGVRLDSRSASWVTSVLIVGRAGLNSVLTVPPSPSTMRSERERSCTLL